MKNNYKTLTYLKYIFIFVLFFTLLFFLWRLQVNFNLLEIIEYYKNEKTILSIFLFISVYVISVIGALPTLPLNLVAGFFWGGFYGGIYSTIGATIGSWFSFILTRSFFGQILTKKTEKQWIDKFQIEFKKNGWKFLAFARINPIFPTSPLNYMLGLTSISSKAFIVTTFIFLLLPSIVIALIGDILKISLYKESEIGQVIKLIFITSGIITLLIFIIIVLKIYMTKKLNQNK